MGLKKVARGHAARRMRLTVLLAVLPLALLATATVANPAQALPGVVTQINQGGQHGKCLDVALENDTTVQLWDCNGGQQQNWNYGAIPPFPGAIQITSWHTGKCLDARNLTAGTAVLVLPCTQAPSQLWLPSTTGDLGTLVNVASGMCLDLRNNDHSNGTIIQQWPCNLTSAQQWYKALGWDPSG